MSQDDIVFDEVKYREPQRVRRPDRDRRWACLAYEVPGPEDLPIFLDRRAADAVERHALRDTSVELGGILLGKECVDDQTGAPFVWVTKSLEAKHYENTQASFTYTHDSWEEMTRERDRLHPDLDIVGWYHTHPDFGVFLSSHDLFIHQHFFAQPLQVAYVVDPIRQTRGFFQWRGGRMEQVGGFHLTTDRSDRAALARLVNDLENVPNPEGGGGALSPRLEAELIAMLTRPPQHHAPAADRTLTAGLFSLIGMMAGILGLAAVLWLYSLTSRVQEQTQELHDLKQSAERVEAAQRLAFDALLSDTAGGPKQFMERYQKARQDRDEAAEKLKRQELANEAIAAKAQQFRDANLKLADALKEASADAKQYEAEAKSVPKLRERLDELEDKVRRQNRELADQRELLDASDTKTGAAYVRKYDRTWYVAAAGWAVSALLCLGLLAAVSLLRPPGQDAEAEPQAQEPPHRIG